MLSMTVLFIFCLNFFRDPKRPIPKGVNQIVSPADGKIVRLDSILSLETYLAAEYQNFDTVLFSCGGSSFSDFKDYKDRGLFFKKIVSNLKDNTR